MFADRLARISIATIGLLLAQWVIAEPRAAATEGTTADETNDDSGEASARAESERLFRQANVEYERGDYPAALALLKRAYEAYPAKALLFDIAQAQRQLSLCDEAKASYAQYLERETDSELRARAEVGLARLGECASAAKVQSAKSATQASPALGTSTPIESRRAAVPPTSAPNKRDTTPTSSGLPAPVWIGWIATGTLAAASATAGVLTLGALADQRNLENRPVSPEQAESTANRARHLALATDVLGGAALVAAGISLYFTLRVDEKSARAGNGARVTTRERWRAVVSLTGVEVRARF